MKSNNFVDALDVTKDALLGMPVLTIVGNYEIYIENFRSIVEYECNYIKILTKKGTFQVQGQCLEILYYDEEEIAIKGRIEKIEL